MVYCRDLADGLRNVTGSWYLSPEQHGKEFVLATLLFAVVLFTVLPWLRQHTNDDRRTDVVRPPLALRIVAFANVLVLLIYKIVGYPGKLLMMLMPCNANWLMLFVLSWYPWIGGRTSHVICQLTIVMAPLAFVAIATPDLSDLLLPLEIPHFYISHTLLPLYPLYFLLSGRVSTLPRDDGSGKRESFAKNFLKWHAVNCALFGAAYFTIVTPLSIVTGINLNYMLQPPLGTGVEGTGYRVEVARTICLVFAGTRLFVVLVESASRRLIGSLFQAEKSNQGKTKSA